MSDRRLDSTTHAGFRAAGAAAAVALVALVALLERWSVVDDRIWRAVLFARGCRTDLVVDRTVDAATVLLTVLFVLAVLGCVRRRGAHVAWPWVATVLLGLLASKTLKHLLTRDRPSALPDVALGFSFPSAHVMNSLLATLAVVALTAGPRPRGRWRWLAAGLTLVVAAGRVSLGRHWTSDVIAGALAAVVLPTVLVPAIARRPLAVPALASAALGAALLADQRIGAAGWRLPSPLIEDREAVAAVDVGARWSRLDGAWAETGNDPNVGPFRWLAGRASVTIEVPAALRDDAGLWIAVGGRPVREPPPCVRVTVEMNGRPLARFVPFSGWREYRFAVPPELVRSGDNDVAVTAETEDGPARFAVAYARLAAPADQPRRRRAPAMPAKPASRQPKSVTPTLVSARPHRLACR